MTREGTAHCPGDRENCERLTSSWERHRRSCADAGIIGPQATVSAMAVGLVIDQWRNSPVEDMHASGRGPSDAAMFAESVSLHGKALQALTAGHRGGGLLDFEKHLLDRHRPWAGTGGRTLRDLGYGLLARYDRHVKYQTDVLLGLNRHTCVADALELFLIMHALMYGSKHKGMPRWPQIVKRIGILLTNPAHPAWGEESWGRRALTDMPPEVPDLAELTQALLSAPAELPVPVLEWLSRHLLCTCGPPYDLDWDTGYV